MSMMDSNELLEWNEKHKQYLIRRQVRWNTNFTINFDYPEFYFTDLDESERKAAVVTKERFTTPDRMAIRAQVTLLGVFVAFPWVEVAGDRPGKWNRIKGRLANRLPCSQRTLGRHVELIMSDEFLPWLVFPGRKHLRLSARVQKQLNRKCAGSGESPQCQHRGNS